MAYRHGVWDRCCMCMAVLGCRCRLLELTYQPIEVAQLTHQLGDAVHGVLAACAGVIGQCLDAEYVAIDLGSHMRLFLYRLGNLAAA